MRTFLEVGPGMASGVVGSMGTACGGCCGCCCCCSRRRRCSWRKVLTAIRIRIRSPTLCTPISLSESWSRWQRTWPVILFSRVEWSGVRCGWAGVVGTRRLYADAATPLPSDPSIDVWKSTLEDVREPLEAALVQPPGHRRLVPRFIRHVGVGGGCRRRGRRGCRGCRGCRLAWSLLWRVGGSWQPTGSAVKVNDARIR